MHPHRTAVFFVLVLAFVVLAAGAVPLTAQAATSGLDRPSVAGAATAGIAQRNGSWMPAGGMVAHAMGGLTVRKSTGATTVVPYTNCLEAFEQNYAKGYRIFEVDLIPTSDGKLAARHDWSKDRYTALGQKYPGHVPTLSEFQATKVFGTFTPLDMERIAQLMRTHPDMYLITDSKYGDTKHTVEEMHALIAALGPDRAELGDRIIVQIYNEQMYADVRSVYPFKNVIYTLYRLKNDDATNSRAVRFAQAKGIRVVVFDMTRWSTRLVSQIRAAGISMAVHTIDSPSTAAMLKANGVRYLYSDSLPADTLPLVGSANATSPTTVVATSPIVIPSAVLPAPQAASSGKPIAARYFLALAVAVALLTAAGWFALNWLSRRDELTSGIAALRATGVAAGWLLSSGLVAVAVRHHRTLFVAAIVVAIVGTIAAVVASVAYSRRRKPRSA